MGDTHIEAAAQLAADLLGPSAAEVEREGVPRTHLDALAKAGLLGLCAPVEVGGSAVPQRVLRTVKEILAGACLTTWFVQAQHHTPVAMLAESDVALRDDLLPRLATGELIAGMAFAHVRRFPDRPVTAKRVGGGWRFHGTAPWYTGWSLNDVALIAGVDEDEQVVWGITEAQPQPCLRASKPIQTVAVAGALTVRLELDELWIPDDHIVARLPFAVWQVHDRARSADARPAVFGVTGATLDVLAGADEPEAANLAHDLRRRLDEVRTRCYSLADDDPDGQRLRERHAARAEAYAVLTIATTAAVAAGGGRAVTPDSPAGRLARAGLFLLVHAQTVPVRTAILRRWGDLAATPPREAP